MTKLALSASTRHAERRQAPANPTGSGSEHAPANRRDGATPLRHQLLALFDRRGARGLLMMLMMMLVGAGLEAVGIGLVVPFVALVTSPDISNQPLLTWLYDRSGLDSPRQLLVYCGAALLAAYVLKNAYLALMYYVQGRFVAAQQVRFGKLLLESYLRAPYSYHLTRNSAELLHNLNAGVRTVFNKLVLPSLALTVECLVILVIGGMLIYVEPVATLSALFAVMGTTALFYLATRARTQRLGREQLRHAGSTIRWVNQALGSLKQTKVCRRESFFVAAYTRSHLGFARAARHHVLALQLPRHAIETIAVGGFLLVVTLVLARGRDLELMAPLLGLFAAAAVRLMPSVSRIISMLTTIRHFAPTLETIHRDLQDIESVSSPPTLDGASLPLTLEQSIELKHVSYSYPSGDTPALDDVSLRIRRGECVAFVGASGAGKTTTVDILLGLLAPTSGTVLVDGQDIRDHLRSWQRSIGYIAQPAYLLDDSIRRNVGFGLSDEEIDDEQVWHALKDAQLDAFVRSLPQQLDTQLGERGVRLSGGQAQRVGIARALYHDPEILVLDEATSALDFRTEREVIKGIDRFRGGKTVLIISHRPSTVVHCDRVFFLEGGRLIQTGRYDELATANRAFRELVRGKDRRSRSSGGSRT